MNENNNVMITGTVDSDFVFSHEVYDENFYTFYIKTNRTSDTADRIKAMVSDRTVDVSRSLVGQHVRIDGQFRSYNELVSDEKKKLILYVFVQDMEFYEGADDNQVYLEGNICKVPTFRKTPFGREISDILLAVNRPYGKSDYIPCVCWGRNAKYASKLPVGSMVAVSGRIQSRYYIKDNLNHNVFEVSVFKIEAIQSMVS